MSQFDHITFVVTDVPFALKFFAILGFEQTHEERISGTDMSSYLRLDDADAEHYTLSANVDGVYQEVQLLYFHSPKVEVDKETEFMGRTGFNHVCFRVADMDATLDKMRAEGIHVYAQELPAFLDRKLHYVEGPAGVTVELAQWLVPMP